MADKEKPDLSNLSEEERKQVLAVLQRAKDFEVNEDRKLMRQPLEGILYKYTNVVKGWQYRWFVLDPHAGLISYYEREDHKKTQKARASAALAGAVVSPSDEDSQTFTIHLASGEVFKLKALDAKERQLWVNRLRATVEHHTDAIAMGVPVVPREARPSLLHHIQQQTQTVFNKPDLRSSSESLTSNNSRSVSSATNLAQGSVNLAQVGPAKENVVTSKSASPPPTSSANKKTLGSYLPGVGNKRSQGQRSWQGSGNVCTPLDSVRDMLTTAQSQNDTLKLIIEGLPSSGEEVTSLDKELLMLKATSAATMFCLEQCLSILHRQNQATELLLPPTITWMHSDNLDTHNTLAVAPVSPAESFVSTSSLPNDSSTDVGCDEEREDEDVYSDTELGPVEEHKSIILHLLSQLKLGMDLTKVVLPTFILERRSLLEMFADCMAHPDIFLKITDQTGPKARMLAVLEWYLTSFHASRRGSIAKKPYNPIIGETFQCSWQVSDNETMKYTAEQVSHHPPISAFYFECPEKNVWMNGSIWTKSKFMGMSIGVVMVGKVQLHLLDCDEEYEFSLPSAYARSILTVPWVELGDRITISCPATGYNAAVTFHTKPFYGGKLHKISAELKNPAAETVCRVAGEWNGQLEFTYTEREEVRVINTESLQTMRKRVKPLQLQSEMESRKLWHKVTENLAKNNIEEATKSKCYLEERQRQGERHRKETNTQYPTKFFHKVGDSWIFNNILTAQTT